MARFIACASVFFVFTCLIVATLLAGQWVAWNGPEWMMFRHQSGTLGLGPGTVLAFAAVVVAEIVVGVQCIIAITGDEEEEK
jgi:hypothetical protein